jgi:hypothetical protein
VGKKTMKKKVAQEFPVLVERAGKMIRAGHVKTVSGRPVVHLTVALTEQEGNSLFNGLARSLYPGKAVRVVPHTESSRKSLREAGYKL